jgi:hypothetical protein
MILCEWDAPEGDPGQSCVHLFARILSTSFSSVSIFSVCCYSIVSISMDLPDQFYDGGGESQAHEYVDGAHQHVRHLFFKPEYNH